MRKIQNVLGNVKLDSYPRKKLYLASIVGLALFYLMSWVVVNVPNINSYSYSATKAFGISLFSARSLLRRVVLAFGGSRSELSNLRDLEFYSDYMLITNGLLLLALLTFGLLIAAVIVKNAKTRMKLAYAGFGLSAISSLAVIIGLRIFQGRFEEELGFADMAYYMIGGARKSLFEFPLAPYIVLIISIAALVFVVERPTKGVQRYGGPGPRTPFY